MATLLSVGVSAVFLAAIAFCVIKLLQKYKDFQKKAAAVSLFPHDPPHWLFGNVKDHPGPTEDGLVYQRMRVARSPRASLGWFGPFIPMIFLKHPDTVKTILRTSEPKGRSAYRFIEPWVGDGLLLSKGDKWIRNRRLLTPAFHFDILKPYLTVKNRATDILLGKLQQFADNNEYFEVFSEVSMFTLDVILKCAFSYDIDCQNLGQRHPYVVAVNELGDMAADRFFKPWLYPDWIYFLTPTGWRFRKHCNYVHTVAEEVIGNRKKALAAGTVEQDIARKKRCMDFLDILLTAKDEDGVGLDPLEIRNEVDTFLFEGHDTTASGISWTMFSLAEHPECQKKIQEEIDDLMAGRQCEDIGMADLSRLPYLTKCIKESLRLHTPVFFNQREITQEMVIDGKTVPKGTLINIILYDVHHNPTVWEDSMEFRPDRFSPENAEGRDPFAFVPFSAGPRNCIGQNFAVHEMKVILSRLLYRFSLELDKNHKVEKKIGPVIRAKNGIRMKAIPRNGN